MMAVRRISAPRLKMSSRTEFLLRFLLSILPVIGFNDDTEGRRLVCD